MLENRCPCSIAVASHNDLGTRHAFSKRKVNSWQALREQASLMSSKTVQINPYLLLFLVVFVSVLGTAWVAAQLEQSNRKLDYAQAVPGQVKFVSGADARNTRNHTRQSDSITIITELNQSGIDRESNRESFWYRYHAHLLPIAVGLFMLSLSGWSLIGVENLAAKVLRT